MKFLTFLSLAHSIPVAPPKPTSSYFGVYPAHLHPFYCIEIYTSTDSMGHCLTIIKNYFKSITLSILTTCFYLVNTVFLRTISFD